MWHHTGSSQSSLPSPINIIPPHSDMYYLELDNGPISSCISRDNVSPLCINNNVPLTISLWLLYYLHKIKTPSLYLQLIYLELHNPQSQYCYSTGKRTGMYYPKFPWSWGKPQNTRQNRYALYKKKWKVFISLKSVTICHNMIHYHNIIKRLYLIMVTKNNCATVVIWETGNVFAGSYCHT
jgi:hypothetical protein